MTCTKKHFWGELVNFAKIHTRNNYPSNSLRSRRKYSNRIREMFICLYVVNFPLFSSNLTKLIDALSLIYSAISVN